MLYIYVEIHMYENQRDPKNNPFNRFNTFFVGNSIVKKGRLIYSWKWMYVNNIHAPWEERH